MTIPTRSEAAHLLHSLEPPDWFLRHACAVADVAAWIARRAAARGLDVDTMLVDTGALLHDVDKLPAVARPSNLRHGDGSAAWLEERGLGELAPVVRDHPVTRLAEPEYERWIRTATLESRIVAYADRRAGQRLEPMAERFASWRRRYPAGPGEHVARGSGTGAPTGSGWDAAVAELVARRAAELERAVCAAAGVDPAGVRRLRWSRRALRDAAT